MSLYVMEKFCEFFYFKKFCPNYILDFRSYGQLLSLFKSSLAFSSVKMDCSDHNST